MCRFKHTRRGVFSRMNPTSWKIIIRIRIGAVKLMKNNLKHVFVPVISAPSSISPRASASWKLSSWYNVLPVRCSLSVLVRPLGVVAIFSALGVVGVTTTGGISVSGLSSAWIQHFITLKSHLDSQETISYKQAERSKMIGRKFIKKNRIIK